MRAELGKWVKRLQFHFSWYGCTITALLATSLLCPNLEQIEFEGDDLLYAAFCKLLTENGKFNYLTTLPRPTNREMAKLYLRCLDYVKDRIISIELYDDDGNTGSLYLDLRNKLDKYPRLKKVILYTNENDYHYDYVMYYLEAMMKKELPSLKELTIESLMDTTYLTLFTMDGSTLFPTNALKKIHIDVYSEYYAAPTEEFMLFMMNNFSNLSHLMCVEKTEEEPSYDNNPKVSLEYYTVTLRFFKFLSKMQHCTFPNITLCSMMALKLIETLYIDIEKEDLATTPRLRSLSISSKSYAEESSYNTIAINIEKKQPKSLHMHLDLIWKTMPVNVDLAQLDTIKRIGRFFDTISVGVENSAHLTNILNHITTYCTRLDHLTILGSQMQAKDMFLDQQEEEGSIKNNNSLKTLTLQECVLSQEQLLCVANQLASLETLVLKDYITPDQDFYSMHLPNLSLKCLELDMETNLDDRLSIEGLYIRLITKVDLVPRCCFLMKEYNDEKDRIEYHLAPAYSSKYAYDKGIRDKKIAMYGMYLNSVEKLTIKYVDAENGRHKTIDMRHTL